MSLVKAIVLRPVGGYGYFKGDVGLFPKDIAKKMEEDGFIQIQTKVEPEEKPKKK